MSKTIDVTCYVCGKTCLLTLNNTDTGTGMFRCGCDGCSSEVVIVGPPANGVVPLFSLVGVTPLRNVTIKIPPAS